MGKSPNKVWEELQQHQKNVRFRDFCRVIEWFGFVSKGGKGSHVTYFQPGIREIVDVQPLDNEAKPYQIKQFMRLVQIHSLKGKE